ncbi:MAG: hypothetical protein JKX84_00895 [Flavobacteriales bacterium]|nr:hypothetical protein [Flavobacteriales bacterium]
MSIKGEIAFLDNCTLSFAEVIDLDEPFKIKYRYHFMDRNGELIFRYDNSGHFPKMRTHPHHKHLRNAVIESAEPDLADVLLEIFDRNFKVAQ